MKIKSRTKGKAKGKKCTFEDICGETYRIFYDDKIKELNIELINSLDDGFCIVFQDWTEDCKSRDILKLHIKEAIRLKAIIDSMCLDAVEEIVCNKRD